MKRWGVGAWKILRAPFATISSHFEDAPSQGAILFNITFGWRASSVGLRGSTTVGNGSNIVSFLADLHADRAISINKSTTLKHN